MTLGAFLICMGSALALGLMLAVVYRLIETPSKSLSVTLATIPAIVCVIIMMVKGSLGASVAVAGTFSLVRFRSGTGTASEIGAVFTAMAIGLACGIGYPLFAAMFALILCAAYVLYAKTGFGENKGGSLRKTLNITIPEELEYSDAFTDIMEEYTSKSNLTRVKTTNLGSLNRLTYDVTLKERGTEKAFIDELRVRNGNLEISLAEYTTGASEL